MSRYTNYAMKNNVFAELYAPISSLATTIQLKSGQGARRGSNFPILATLESIDSNGKVQKREIVKITGISGDYLTVVRGFAACPANDDANSQGTTTFSFEADDRINMYVPKEIFDKIGDTLNDIYENGLNKLRVDVVSGLQIQVGAGPVLVGSAYYDFAGDDVTLTDNATNYVEIDEDGLLVANTTNWVDENTKIAKVTTSGGAVTSIEDRRLGTVGGKIGGVNIHDLTEKNSLSQDDEFIVADSDNIYNNKRVKYSVINRPRVDVLIVGGGGAGGGGASGGLGNHGGGGGGGGEVIEMNNHLLGGSTSFAIVVGSGGAKAAAATGGNGNSSCFGSIKANGGCGGTSGGIGGASGNGNAGGQVLANKYGAGGGGATGAGSIAIYVCSGSIVGGNGGNGHFSNISGANTGYGGGGGGSGSTAGSGTAGGGNGNGGNATGCGGGGGGGSCASSSSGGDGGAGVVIVRYGQNGECGINCATGGTITCCNGYVIHTFTNNGTFCIVS